MLAALSPLVKVRVDCRVLPETWPLPPRILIPQGFVLVNGNGFRSYKWHDLCSPSAGSRVGGAVCLQQCEALSSAVGSGVSMAEGAVWGRGANLKPKAATCRGFSESPKMSMTQMTFLRKLVKMKRPHFPISGVLKMNKGSVTSLFSSSNLTDIYGICH